MLMMHFFLLTHTLKVFRRVEFLQRSEVRIEIGAHIDEQINFLDRVFGKLFEKKTLMKIYFRS